MSLLSVYRQPLCGINLRCIYPELKATLTERKILTKTSGIIGASKRYCGINAWDQPLSADLRKKIDEHWKDKLPPHGFDETSDKEKFYMLSMYPYPSGKLHMGHVRVYCISDAIARYNRMIGKNVLHPMGWDAFGLPAENAALEKQLDPDLWTQDNIATMKKHMEMLNLSFDWDREFASCDSDYYKWTQFFFIKLFENDLVYRKKAVVNWDPVDHTVLADEQVDESGRSWRSGAVVEKKLLDQWFIRTTKFSKSMYEGTIKPDFMKNWEDVAKLQKHWIGECKGTTIDFKIENNSSKIEHDYITIWMKNPEYIDKAKFVAVQPNSLWDIGGDETGLLPYKVINPITAVALPVYVTQNIEYPEGADSYIGVPEMIEMDRVFAESIGMKVPATENVLSDAEWLEYREKVCEELKLRKIGGFATSPKIKDWLISRQRYWGTPIPIIHCKDCGPQTVPESDLPIKLPKLSRIQKGKNHLAEVADWYNTTCPKCKGKATRETDTMDTFVDSSWYYLRFLDPDNVNAAFSVEKAKKFMPVDLYIGGKEHAVLHLYYSRFFTYFLHSAGLLENAEPFIRLLPQGIVKGQTFKSSKTGEYVQPRLVELKNNAAYHKETGESLIVSWEKMSKSKHNGLEPSDMIKDHGVDSTRLIVLAEVPPRTDRNWSERSYPGIFSFQDKLWSTIAEFQNFRKQGITTPSDEKELKKEEYFLFDSRNYYTRKINKCFSESHNISVAISCMQGLIGNIRKSSQDTVSLGLEYERALASVIIFLAPVAPCFASELWSGFMKAPNRVCKSGEISWDVPLLNHPWPTCDSDYVYGKYEKDTGVKVVKFSAKPKEKKNKKKKKESEDSSDSESVKENIVN